MNVSIRPVFSQFAVDALISLVLWFVLPGLASATWLQMLYKQDG